MNGMDSAKTSSVGPNVITADGAAERAQPLDQCVHLPAKRAADSVIVMAGCLSTTS
jgi:hypothetical protein